MRGGEARGRNKAMGGRWGELSAVGNEERKAREIIRVRERKCESRYR